MYRTGFFLESYYILYSLKLKKIRKLLKSLHIILHGILLFLLLAVYRGILYRKTDLQPSPPKILTFPSQIFFKNSSFFSFNVVLIHIREFHGYICQRKVILLKNSIFKFFGHLEFKYQKVT